MLSFGLVSFFVRFFKRPGPVFDSLSRNAYGIYLVHYAFALWIQYCLYDVDRPAILKVLIGYAVTLALSWALTAGLRRIPGATRVL